MSTETEHWQECVYCHTATEKSAHKMAAWETIVKAGYTFQGEKQSECKVCEFAVKEAIPELGVPSDKFVIAIPGYDLYVPSDTSSGDAASSSGSSGEVGSDNPAAGSGGMVTLPEVSLPVTKEFLSKGEEKLVPALPTLPPTEDGNIFVGWVNIETGEAVNKGDKLSGNIEIEPVWKDCGEENHTDTNEDEQCDDCGYILKKSAQPEDTPVTGDEPAADNGQEGDASAGNEQGDKATAGEEQDGESTADKDQNGKTPQEKEGFPTWLAILISCVGAVVAICGAVLVVVLKKKKE